MILFCQKCGAQLADNITTCSGCGASTCAFHASGRCAMVEVFEPVGGCADRGSADFQSAVSPSSTRLTMPLRPKPYRIGRPSGWEIRDTADWKFALQPRRGPSRVPCKEQSSTAAANPAAMVMEKVKAASKDALEAFKIFGLDPVGKLAPACERLGPVRALGAGVTYGIASALGILLAIYRVLPPFVRPSGLVGVLKILVAAIVPILAFFAATAAAQNVCRTEGDFRQGYTPLFWNMHFEGGEKDKGWIPIKL